MPSITINISEDERGTLQALVAQVPLGNKHALARLALRVGLDALSERPERIVQLLAGQRMRITGG